MKKILLSMSLIMLILSSCKKDDFDKMVVQIEGIVTNAKTGGLVSGASVKVVTNGGEVNVSTNDFGYFNLGDLNIGSYIVIVQKDSFLTSMREISYDGYPRFDGNSKEVQNVEIELSPLTETLNITIFKRYDYQSVRLAASNIPFTLYLGKFYDPIKGTTDANGLLLLKNMPYPNSISSDMYLEFDFEENGTRYKGSYSYYDIYYNDWIQLTGYTEESVLGIVSTNIVDSHGHGVEDFGLNDDITVVFNQPIDVDIIEDYQIDISNYYNDFDVTWSENNMKMTISFSTTLTSDRTYVLDLSYLMNEANTQTYSINIEFSTEE